MIELPLTVPLDAPPPPERAEAANAALERAKEVGEEYETVEVHPSVVRARSVGAGIVEAARDRGVEMIVMGAEPPTRIRGGAMLGGVGGSRPGGDRAGDRVRAAAGAVPGAGHGAAHRRLAARRGRLGRDRAEEAIGREGALPVAE